MKNKTITKRILIAITAILLIFSLILTHNLHQSNKALKTTIEVLKIKDKVSKNGYEYYLTRANDTIRGMGQMLTTQKIAIEMGLISENYMKDNYLKKIQVINHLEEEIRIFNKKGEYIEYIYEDKTDITTIDTTWKYITTPDKPFKMVFTDPYYYLAITAHKLNPVLDSLKILSVPTITLSTRKEGIFKKKEKVALYKNENPFIYLKSMSSLTIEDPEKWHETTLAKVLAGAVAGAVFVSIIK